MSRTRRDRPGSPDLTLLNSGIDDTPTTPFDPIAQRDAARANADPATRCHYLKPSGDRCGSPAMHGHDLCYYHHRYQPKPEYRNLPCLEDPHSVQCAIQEVIEDMLRGYIDYKKAALALYGLQTAASNLKQMRLAEKDRCQREEEQMNTGRTQETRRDLDSCFDEDEVEEIELAARPTTNDHRPATLLESPRPPQRVTQGGLTNSEREARDAHMPDLDKLREEILGESVLQQPKAASAG